MLWILKKKNKTKTQKNPQTILAAIYLQFLDFHFVLEARGARFSPDKFAAVVDKLK